jgi:hypothetical protein
VQPVTIKAAEQLDTRWFIVVLLALSVPLLLLSGGWLLLGVIPVIAGLLFNLTMLRRVPVEDVIRSQSGRWYQVNGQVTEEITLKAHWLWPHLLLMQWVTERGDRHHRIVFRHQLQPARYSQLVVGLQQDKIEHD